MKVKGWVVVCTLDEDLTPLNAGDKNKILFFNIKKEAKEQDYKDGHKKGVRDMWEAGKEKCEGEAYFDGNNSAECKDNCTFETCPIAQKLLKGVE